MAIRSMLIIRKLWRSIVVGAVRGCSVGSTYLTLKKRKVRAKMDAGKYFICDPCYLFHGQNEGGVDWIEFLEMFSYFDRSGGDAGAGVYKFLSGVREYQFAVSNTAHGDGGYNSNFPTAQFDVDAGMIGAIPVEMFSAVISPGKDPDEYASSEGLYIHDFTNRWEFEPCDSDGDITFYTRETNYVIVTDDYIKLQQEIEEREAEEERLQEEQEYEEMEMGNA
jgi:hypothetical protein